jgi:Mor family transcriptional regulator
MKSKLNASDVYEILDLRSSGLTYKEISERYDVSSTAILAVCKGRTWKNLTTGFVNVLMRCKGSRSHLSRMTEADVIAIRHLSSKGVMHKDLAKLFNLSTSGIGRIVNGNRWQHLTPGDR